MDGFDWSRIPTWVWVVLVIAALIVTPIKLKIFAKLLKRGKQEQEEG